MIVLKYRFSWSVPFHLIWHKLKRVNLHSLHNVHSGFKSSQDSLLPREWLSCANVDPAMKYLCINAMFDRQVRKPNDTFS